MLATKITPVEMVMADGETTIGKKVAKLEKLIRDTAKAWSDTQSEYEDWAERTTRQAMASIANRAFATIVVWAK